MDNPITKNHPPAFKARVALEAAKDIETAGQIASRFQVHPTQVGFWKHNLIRRAPELFSEKKKQTEDTQELIEKLYMQIGRKETEIEFLKKKVGYYSK